MPIRTWDKEIDYKEWEKRLKHDLKMYRDRVNKTGKKRYLTRFTYTAILLVQLINGTRCIEAVKAVYFFVETGEREYKVKAAKGGERRVIFIPPYITYDDINLLRLSLSNRTIKDVNRSVRVYAVRFLKINTHSLRYAAITYFSDVYHLPDQIVAKITGHTKTKYIRDYIQSRTAKDILREHVFGGRHAKK